LITRGGNHTFVAWQLGIQELLHGRSVVPIQSHLSVRAHWYLVATINRECHCHQHVLDLFDTFGTVSASSSCSEDGVTHLALTKSTTPAHERFQASHQSRRVSPRRSSGSLRFIPGTARVLHDWRRALPPRFVSSPSEVCLFRAVPARPSFLSRGSLMTSSLRCGGRFWAENQKPYTPLPVSWAILG